jgi:hypothetical protein
MVYGASVDGGKKNTLKWVTADVTKLKSVTVLLQKIHLDYSSKQLPCCLFNCFSPAAWNHPDSIRIKLMMFSYDAITWTLIIQLSRIQCLIYILTSAQVTTNNQTKRVQLTTLFCSTLNKRNHSQVLARANVLENGYIYIYIYIHTHIYRHTHHALAYHLIRCAPGEYYCSF